MTSVIFQPAGNAGGREHYVNTIEQPVLLAKIAEHLQGPVLESLRGRYGDRPVPVWGVTPGKNGVNEGKWNRIQEGDWALFLQDAKAVAAGRVTEKVHSPELAKSLWRVNEDGDTWEFVYFLDDMRSIDVPYSELNAAAEYDAANRFQGFNVLEGPRADAVIALTTATSIGPRLPSRNTWLVRQAATSRYGDVEGAHYEYPATIPNGRQIKPSDVLVCYRNADEARGRPIFGVGHVDRVEPRDERLLAVYDRYVALDPELSWDQVGGDPRTNQRNSINLMPKNAVQRLFNVAGIDPETLAPVVGRAEPRLSEEPGVWKRKAISIEDLEASTLWTRDELQGLCDLIRGESGQVILAGPPGTSKTWVARNVAEYLTQGEGQLFKVVQFHPSYSYEEFIEGLRPTADARGVIQFSQVPGVLLRFLHEIGDRPGPHVLLIDELNRANLPKVLGELMYLFEYRNERIDLRYRADFSLPDTIRFFATMNTADRSIRSIDSALRRRFKIIECRPRRDVLERYYSHPDRRNDVGNLLDGFDRLNEELEGRLDRHHRIGHTFFMERHMTRKQLGETWEHTIEPLLEEYFFDQPDVARSFNVDQFWPA